MRKTRRVDPFSHDISVTGKYYPVFSDCAKWQKKLPGVQAGSKFAVFIICTRFRAAVVQLSS